MMTRFFPRSAFTSVESSRPVALGKRLVARAGEHDLSGLAAELAYRGLLAIFPFFIFVAALSAYVTRAFGIDDPTTKIIDRIGDNLPEDAAGVLEGQLRGVLEAQDPGLLTFGLLFTIFAATAAMNTIIKALNRIYGMEEVRPFWHKTTLSVALTLLAGAGMIGAATLLVVGHVFGDEIADELDLGSLYGTLISLGRWPVILAIVLIAATLLYRFAPAKRIALPWTSLGALAFTLLWAAGTLLFGLYISNFGSYQVSYGTLAGVVILMIWFYLSSFLLLVGAELNRILSEEADAPIEVERRAGEPERTRESAAGTSSAG
jgi:membrane protein